MRQVGFLVPHVGAGQLGYSLITQLNKVSENLYKYNLDPIVYYETMHMQLLPHAFATMQIVECWDQTHPVIATSLSTAEKMITFPNPQRKLFYVWDVEWLRRPHNHYFRTRNIVTNEAVEIVARGSHHATLIENCFNRKVTNIVDDFEIESFMEILGYDLRPDDT